MNEHEVIETLKMIEEEKLDIRCITMGISLRDCMDEKADRACSKIYDKITGLAKNLVAVGKEIEETYGVPIINKRISVTRISLVAESSRTGSTIDRPSRSATKMAMRISAVPSSARMIEDRPTPSVSSSSDTKTRTTMVSLLFGTRTGA